MKDRTTADGKGMKDRLENAADMLQGALTILADIAGTVMIIWLAIRDAKAPEHDFTPEHGTETTEPAPENRTEKSDWDSLILAIAWRESGWDETAVGTHNDVGYLQITPVLVTDVNRILGKETYRLEDRLSKEKSVEMFNIIQNHYNPQKDTGRAIRIWNPKAPGNYGKDIMEKYNEIKSL